MKKLFFVAFVAVMAFVIGCGGGGSGGGESQEAEGTLLASKTIGGEGGALASDDFNLTVPEGAFSTNAEIKVYVEPIEEPFGEFSASKLFRIEGVLADFQLPLKVKLKYSAVLSGISYMAIGEKEVMEFAGMDEEKIVYDLCEAEEEDGYLTCEIPSLQTDTQALAYSRTSKADDQNLSKEELVFWVGLLYKGKKWNPFSGHFEVKGVYADEQQESVDKIISYLEQAYVRFEQAGFDYSSVAWPMGVNFIKNPSVSEMQVVSYSFNWNLISIIHNDNFTVMPLQREWIEASFVYALGNEYKLFALWASLKYGRDLIDDEIAIKQWMKVPSPLPVTCANNFVYNDDFNYECYSSIALGIEYLTERYTEKIISQIFSDDETVPDETEWASDFYRYLMTDDRFSGLPDNFWSSNSHHAVVINDAFKEKEFSDLYGATAKAKWFHIAFSKNLQDGSSLDLVVDNKTANISIVKHKNGKFESVTDAVGEVSVSDVDKLAKEGYDLFAIVVNLEKMAKTITLTIKKTQQRYSVVASEIHLRSVPVNVINYNEDGTTAENVVHESFHFYSDRNEPFTFTNNEFYQSFERKIPSKDETYKETIRIKFNNDLTKIVNFSAYSELKRDDAYYNYTTYERISGSDIEKDYWIGPSEEDATEFVFATKGPEICNAIDDNITYFHKKDGKFTFEAIGMDKDENGCISHEGATKPSFFINVILEEKPPA